MKKILLTFSLFLIGIACFSQAIKTNGTIYIKHPYINVINKSMKEYVAQDNVALAKHYADTAKFWGSGMDTTMSISDAIKMWSTAFTFYDSIQVMKVGYPDYLHYVDKDAKVVQSWWRWSGKSKKTGVTLKIDFVQFDSFNKAGKIDFEGIYGDFSKME